MATNPDFIVIRSDSGGFGVGPGGGSNLVPYHQRPKGTYDGVNTVFTLDYAPNPQSWLILAVNGNCQMIFPSPDNSVASDYSLSGNTITFATAPKANDQVEAWYFIGKGKINARSGKARLFGTTTNTSSAGFASAIGRFVNSAAGTSAALFTTSGSFYPDNGDTVKVGPITYTFVLGLNNAVANQVLLTSEEGFFVSLARAINTGGDGVNVSTPTTPNPDCTATATGFGGQQIYISILPEAPDDPTLLSVSGSLIWWVGGQPDASTTGALSNTSGLHSSMNNGDTVTPGSTVYKFVDVLSDTTPYQILTTPPPGTTLAEMLANAINGGFGSGVYYSAATTANTQVTAAANVAAQTVMVTAKTSGSVGNSILLFSTSAGRFTWNSASLSGGTGGGTGVSSDRVDWGNVPDTQITTDMAAGVWFTLAPNVTGGAVLYQGEDTLGTDPTNDLFALILTVVGGKLHINYVHESPAHNVIILDFGVDLQPDTWYYAGFSRNASTKTVKMYLGTLPGDSVALVSTQTYATALNGGTGDVHFTVGNQYSDWLHVANGVTIEEYYIWNAQRTLGEHISAAQGNPLIDTSMMLGTYGGDTPEIDISGNNNVGNVTGTTIVQGHP